MLSPRRARRTALIRRRAEQEQEVTDGEASSSESLPPERRTLWPGVSPDPNYVPPPAWIYSLGDLTYLREPRPGPRYLLSDTDESPEAHRPRGPGKPTDVEAGPWTHRNQSTNENTPLQMLGPRTRARRLALITRRAEQEEEVVDGEESGSESLLPERRVLWSGLSPDPNYVPPPDRTYSLGYLTHLSVMETVRALAEEPPSPEPSPSPWDLLSDTDESTEAHRPRRPRGPLASPLPRSIRSLWKHQTNPPGETRKTEETRGIYP